MAAVTGGLLAAGLASQLGSNIAQNIGSRKAQKRAFAHNIDMWNRANEYNDPSAQMARLKAAGLNPNLVYGSGSVTGNTTTQTPKYQAEEVKYDVDAGRVMQTLGQYNNIKVQNAQVDNLEAHAENTRARTITEFIKGSKYISESQKAQIEAGVAKELQQTNIETGKQQLELIKSKITTEQKNQMLKDIETELKKKEVEWMKSGVTKGDSLWMRQVMEWMNEFGIKRRDLTNRILKWFK